MYVRPRSLKALALKQMETKIILEWMLKGKLFKFQTQSQILLSKIVQKALLKEQILILVTKKYIFQSSLRRTFKLQELHLNLPRSVSESGFR